MRILVLLILATQCILAQTPALKLLDRAKSLYGNPCYIGLPSPIIDSLSKFQSEYAVKDFLSQWKQINSALLAAQKDFDFRQGSYKLPENFIGRERNIINISYIIAQQETLSGPGLALISAALIHSDYEKISDPIPFFEPGPITFNSYGEKIFPYINSLPQPWYHAAPVLSTIPNSPIK